MKTLSYFCAVFQNSLVTLLQNDRFCQVNENNAARSMSSLAEFSYEAL